MIITNSALNAVRNFWRDHIGSARYTIGGNTYDAQIHETKILSDSRVEISFYITANVTGTISKVVLLDGSGQVWVEKDENIAKTDSNSGYLYKFHFAVSEIEEE